MDIMDLMTTSLPTRSRRALRRAGVVENGVPVRHLKAFGTSVTLALEAPEAIDRAAQLLASELDAIDRSCSRFRADSEMWDLYSAERDGVQVSPLLFEAITTACDVARRTGGAVDPTVGEAMEAIGYDRDFEEVRSVDAPLEHRPRPAPGWWRVELDHSTRSVRLPPGVRLDLGASAKALAADRAAHEIASAVGCGALVSIGGDVSVAGPPPPGGWAVGISVDSSTPPEAVGHVVSISSGGLASSSTAVRTWRRAGRKLHHIVDPRTGDVASDCWRLVTVAAASCVDANAASTAAIVWGSEAVDRLEELALPARLVRRDGRVIATGGWPSEVPWRQPGAS